MELTSSHALVPFIICVFLHEFSYAYAQDGLTALARAKEPAFEFALPSLQRRKNEIVRLFEVRVSTCGCYRCICRFQLNFVDRDLFS